MALNGTIIGRVAWKELRALGPFWVGMAALTIFLELLVAAVTYGNNVHGPDVAAIFMVAIGLPAFYALGCGATMFAAEHETETYDFLRSLPLKPAELLLGKVAFAVVSTPLLLLLCWLTAVGISGGRLPPANYAGMLWGLWGFAWVELLVWGMLFSLLLKQPMKAAMLGAAGAGASVHFLTMDNTRPMQGMDIYASALPSRIIVAAAVGLVAAWLALRWFGEEAAHGSGEAAEKSPDSACGATMPSRTAAFGRLLWLQWRQSRSMIAILSVAVLLFVFSLAGKLHWSWFSADGEFVVSFSLLAAIIAMPMAGASVFVADQRRCQFRFLANRGVRPGAMWFSRHAVWGGFVVLSILLAMAVAMLFVGNTLLHTTSRSWQSSGGVGSILFVAMAFVVVAYAVGQLWSMFLRSSIVAGTAAVACTVVMCMWMSFMFILRVNPLWSVMPIPLALLAATRLRTSGWLLERNTLRAWLPVVAVVVVPGVAIVAGVCVHRVVEIPLIEPGFSVEQFTSPAPPEAMETARMYRRAFELMVGPGESSKDETPEARRKRLESWVKRNERTIALVMQTSRRPTCDALEINAPQTRLPDAAAILGDLLVESAQLHQRQGELDEALQRYLAALRMANHVRTRSEWPRGADRLERSVYPALSGWAAHAEQTPERIAAAIGEIAELARVLPSRADQIKHEYIRVAGMIDGGPAEIFEQFGDSGLEPWVIAGLYMLPWERARGHRALNYVITTQLERVRAAEADVARGLLVELVEYSDLFDRRDRYPWDRATPIMNFYFGDATRHLRNEWKVLARRRATLAGLALAAWRLEHGELPESLDPLVGTYLEEMPIDPYAGEPFRYFREGLPTALKLYRWSHREEDAQIVAADQPFLWSLGPSLCVVHGTHPLDKYCLRSGARYRPRTEQEIWSHGMVFPIP